MADDGTSNITITTNEEWWGLSSGQGVQLWLDEKEKQKGKELRRRLRRRLPRIIQPAWTSTPCGGYPKISALCSGGYISRTSRASPTSSSRAIRDCARCLRTRNMASTIPRLSPWASAGQAL